MMIAPRKLKLMAKKKEDENIRFRTFLKCNADENELDEQFARLHRELFENYDCSRCRNCCKSYYGSVPATDIDADAKYLNMTAEDFINLYFKEKDVEGNYQTKHMPCDFLQENGSCKLGECKPDNCKKYPYTDQPDRLHSLYSVLEAVEICPVEYEIWERLKEECGFEK